MKIVEERLNLDEIYDLNIGYISVVSFSIVVAFIIGTIDLVKRYSNTKELRNGKHHF